MRDVTTTRTRTGGWWAVTILSVLLGLLFLATGGMKLMNPAEMVPQFQAWGYPAWFVPVVGIAEVAGAFLLLLPATRVIGAVLLIIIMIGAAGTHILAAQWTQAVFPIVLLFALVWITRRMAWEHQRADLPPGEHVHAPS